MNIRSYILEAKKLKWNSTSDMGKKIWDSEPAKGRDGETQYTIIKHSSDYYSIRKTDDKDIDALLGEKTNLKDAKKAAEEDL